MTEPRPRPYPSIPAVIFTLWVLVVPLLFGDRMLNADGDMLRHVAHGRWMLDHGQFLHTDQFSYTKGGEPFVAFEYGSQLLYALVERLAGLAGVVVFGSLLIAASYAVVARFLLARGADPFSTYATTMVAAVIGAVHWAARPHLITLLFVALLLFFLEPGERRPKLWVLFLMFMVWANLHGGFVFGLTLLGIYLVGSLAEWRWGADPALWKERSRYYALALLVAGLGTLVNPNGLALHLHIIRFFGEPFLRDNTEEFLSPDFHSVAGADAHGVAAGRSSPCSRSCPAGRRFHGSALLLANVAFALQARRNVQLYAVVVFPVLALHFDAAVRRLPDPRGIRAVFERDARRGTTGIFVGTIATVMVVMVLLQGRVGSWRVVPDQLDPMTFPVAAVNQARAEGIEGRIFHEFIWGGYLLYAWPEQRVFIDGGTDFYGPDLMRTFMETRGLKPGLAGDAGEVEGVVPADRAGSGHRQRAGPGRQLGRALLRQDRGPAGAGRRHGRRRRDGPAGALRGGLGGRAGITLSGLSR